MSTAPIPAHPPEGHNAATKEPSWARVTVPPLPGAGTWWGWLLASTRWNLSRVCSESAALGEHDYHNHRDDADGAPWHVEGRRRCARCGKWFRLY